MHTHTHTHTQTPENRQEPLQAPSEPHHACQHLTAFQTQTSVPFQGMSNNQNRSISAHAHDETVQNSSMITRPRPFFWGEQGFRSFFFHTVFEFVTLSSKTDYGVVSVSRIDQIIGLFCKRAL